MGFEQTTFGEYAKIQGGNAYKSKDFIEKSLNKVLKIKNVRFGTVNYDDSGYISDELAEKTKAWKASEGDILISMTGSGPNAPQSLVGRVARVWKNEPNAWINQRVGRIQLKDKDIIHPDFLFYLLSLPQSQDFLVSNSSGSANQANISGKIIELLPCPKVTFKQSEYIADIARSLDEKIIINKQTNQTLEQMAQTLFKSWFVDFDPVFDNLLAKADFKIESLDSTLPEELVKKAEIRLLALNGLAQAEQTKASLKALAQGLSPESPEILPQHATTHAHFPNEFEHNEQFGWIPKGWAASKLKEFGKVITGKTPPKKIDDAFDIEGIPFITPTDVDGDVFTLNVARHLTENGLGAVKNNIVEAGSISVTCIGSQMGKTIIVPEKSVTNQQLNSIVLSEKYFRNYIFMNLRARREELFNLGSSGSTMPILNKSSFENLSVLKPNESSLKAFSDITERYLAKILLNSQQNVKLTAIRDTLLPKLISGELQIPDVKASDEKTT